MGWFSNDDEDDRKVVHVEKTQDEKSDFFGQILETASLGVLGQQKDEYQVTLDDGTTGTGETPEQATEDAKSK